jgi:hypothetical protein
VPSLEGVGLDEAHELVGSLEDAALREHLGIAAR